MRRIALTARTLADFAGAWRIDRTIDDRRAGQQGRFTGRAVLDPDDAGLIYSETGLLRIGAAAPMQADRRYLWRQEAGRIAVFFEDGRPFHDFDPNAAQPEAAHWCAPDSYRVAYDFSAWPEWRARWEVAGPHKAYSMVSHYARAA